MGNKSDKHTVVIFAKVSGNGTVKSGIAETHGKKKAAAIYDELLKITADTVSNFPYHIAYTDSEEYRPLEQVFTHAQSFFMQQGNTPGERLHNAFTHLFNQGYAIVCAIGVDCPTLSKSDITQVFFLLKSGFDAVIGPSHDGGYYCIAGNRKCLDIFSAKQWDTPGLCDETILILESHSLPYWLLKPRFGIHRMEDYQQWKKSQE